MNCKPTFAAPLMCGLVLLSWHSLGSGGIQAEEPERPKTEPRAEVAKPLPADVQERNDKRRSPREDALLYRLEADYLALLKKAANPQALLEAEELLATTNDNSRWTNYSAASRLLRKHREPAAIPLLLTYIVLHAERRRVPRDDSGIRRRHFGNLRPLHRKPISSGSESASADASPRRQPGRRLVVQRGGPHRDAAE